MAPSLPVSVVSLVLAVASTIAPRRAVAPKLPPLWLVFRHAASGGDPAAAAAASALGSLSSPGRVRYAATLSDIVERLRARMSPLDLALETDNPVEDLRLLVSAHLPRFTASRALWGLLDDGAGEVLRVRWSRRCDEGALCIPLSRGGDARHLRFAAWPLACAGVVRARNRAERDQLAAILRGRSEAASRIGLALLARDFAPRVPAAVSSAARRLVAMLRRMGADHSSLWIFRGLAARTVVSSRPADLDPLEILVVPRLGALAEIPAFAAEVEAEIDRTGATWIHRPVPLD